MEYAKKPIRPRLLLLDVYETILSMHEIEKRINYRLNSKRAYLLWFELCMQYSFVDNSILQFHDFSTLADAALRTTARLLDQEIHPDDSQEILALMKQLPIHEDVQEGLSSLYNQGFRVAALTNSSEKIVTDRMNRTGLDSYFEVVLSAEQVKKYKPALEVYAWAAAKLQLPPREILLVSAHGWDLAGAEKAGMQTACLSQSRHVVYPLAPQPDYSCKNLKDLADQLQQLYPEDASSSQ
jgi:2-haloacid dehalogenase